LDLSPIGRKGGQFALNNRKMEKRDAGRLEYCTVGILEYWKIGILEHHSIIPPFHHSSFSYSTIP
jgi:hypothetical protein